MRKLYDVHCNHCGLTEERFVNDFYEVQTCTQCNNEAKCIYSPLDFHMKRSTFGRTKEGTKWEYVGAGPISPDSRTVDNPKK